MSDAVNEAEAHLRTCDACRRFLAGQTEWAAEIERLAPRPVAPAAVRERVFEGLARERVHQPAARRRVAVGMGGLALATAAIFGITLWVMRSEPGDLAWRQQVAAVAEDHVRSTHEESITSADAGAVQQWLSVRVPFAVHMPTIPGAVLQGARLCYLDGHRGSVLRYQVDGDEVSFYVMPIGSSNAPPPAPEQFLRGVERGYQVVAWQHAGLIHALVGNVPEVRLLQMARYCVDRLGATGNQPAERVAPLAARLR